MTKPCFLRTLFLLEILQIINRNPVNGLIAYSWPNTTYIRYSCKEKKFNFPTNMTFNEKFEESTFRNVPYLTELVIRDCDSNKILKGMFQRVPNLEYVSIDHNQIDSIEYQALANLTRLKYVDASDNKLDHFESGWFDFSTNLEVLIFRKNKIHEISRGAFAGLYRMKMIDFSYNDISTIVPGAFADLGNLEHLALSHNRLRRFQADLFPNKLKIQFLDISDNQLNFLPQGLMDKITVTVFIIDLNPWKCPCLDMIYYWLFTTNSTVTKNFGCDVSKAPVCAIPRTFSTSCLEYIDEEVTQRYSAALRNLSDSLGECARLYYR